MKCPTGELYPPECDKKCYERGVKCPRALLQEETRGKTSKEVDLICAMIVATI